MARGFGDFSVSIGICAGGGLHEDQIPVLIYEALRAKIAAKPAPILFE
jgi:hypothetical protein